MASYARNGHIQNQTKRTSGDLLTYVISGAKKGFQNFQSRTVRTHTGCREGVCDFTGARLKNLSAVLYWPQHVSEQTYQLHFNLGST